MILTINRLSESVKVSPIDENPLTFNDQVIGGLCSGYVNGAACEDDLNPKTVDEYQNGICVHTDPNKCFGEPSGSTTKYGLIVVDNTTIKTYAKTATPICTSNVTSIGFLYYNYNGHFSNIEDWDVSNENKISNFKL